MTNKQAVIEIIIRAVDKATTTLKGIGGGLSDFGSKIGSVIESGISSAIRGLEALAGFVTRFAADAMDVASEFESKMSAVNSILKVSRDEMVLLGQEAMRLGRITRYSADDAAAAMEVLASSGMEFEHILNGATEAALALAAATGGDVKEAASIMAGALSMFGLTGAQAKDAVDGMAAAINNSLMSMSEFRMAMQAGGSMAAAYKWEIDEVSTVLGLFAKNGIKGSDAGTQMARMLQYVQGNSEAAKKALAELGIITADGKNQFYDLNGELKSARDVIGILQTATKGLTDEEKQNALGKIFGMKAQRGVNLLLKEGVEGYDALAKKMADTSASDIAAERMNNYKGAMDRLLDSWKTMKISLATGLLLPMGKDAANWANDILAALGPLTDWVYENGPAMWGKFKVRLTDWFDASGLEEVFAPIKNWMDLIFNPKQKVDPKSGMSLMPEDLDAGPTLSGLEQAFKDTWERIKTWGRKQLADLFSGDDVKGSLTAVIDSVFGGGSSEKVAKFAEAVGAIVMAVADVVTFFSDLHTTWTTKVVPVLNAPIPGTSWMKFDYTTVRAEWQKIKDFLNAPLGPKIAAFFAFDVGEALGLNNAQQKLDDWWGGVVTWWGGLGAKIAGLFTGGGGGKGKAAGGGRKGGGFDLSAMLGLPADPVAALSEWWTGLELWAKRLPNKIKHLILGDDEVTSEGPTQPGGGLLQMLGLTSQPEIHLEAWWAGVQTWFAGLKAKIAGLFGGGEKKEGGAEAGGGGLIAMLGLSTAGEDLAAWFEALPGQLSGVVSGAFTAIFGPVPEDVKADFDLIRTNISERLTSTAADMAIAWEGIKTVLVVKWTEYKTEISTKCDEIKTYVALKWEEMKTSISESLDAIWSTIKLRWDSFLREVSEKMDRILGKVTEKWSEMKTNISTKLSEIGASISQKWGEFVADIERFASDMRDKATERWNELKANASTAWTNMKADGARLWGDFKTNVLAIAGEVYTGTMAKVSPLVTDLSTKWGQIKTDATKGWGDIKTAISTAWSNLISDVKKKLSEWGQIGEGIIQGIKDGFNRKLQALRDSFWDGIRDVIGVLKTLLGIASPADYTKPIGGSLADGIGVQFVSSMRQQAVAMGNAALSAANAVARVIQSSGLSEVFLGVGERVVRVIAPRGETQNGRSIGEVRAELLGQRDEGGIVGIKKGLNGLVMAVSRALGAAGGSMIGEAWDSDDEDRAGRLTRPIGPKTNFTRKGRGGMIYTSQFNYWEKWSKHHGLPIPEGVQEKGRAFSPEALEAIRSYTRKMVDEWRKALDKAKKEEKAEVPGTGAGSGGPDRGSIKGVGGGFDPPQMPVPPLIRVAVTSIVRMGQTEIARSVTESEPVAAWKADIWAYGGVG